MFQSLTLASRFHDHGDTIAIQYGGSHLVNTMATYRKINHWQSHSRDMVESFKRYYHNSFLDSQRQEAYNLFLGNYVFAQGQPMLWDLATDYYLHHADPRAWLDKARRDYIDWFTPAFLGPRSLPKSTAVETENPESEVSQHDDYWLEYYKPLAVSSFVKIFSFRMNSNARYIPDRTSHTGRYNLSPFHPRKPSTDADSPYKKHSRKGVTIVDPYSDDAPPPPHHTPPNRQSSPLNDSQIKHSILRDPRFEIDMPPQEAPNPPTFVPADKSLMNQWTLNQFYDNSLNPSVTVAEADEYQRYVDHPLNLPLVVSTEVPKDNSSLGFMEYLSVVSGDGLEDFVRGKGLEISEEDIAGYADFLAVAENPLTVNEEDGGKKRYKAYRQWLRGKSLFKQSKVDPEYKMHA